MQPTRTDRTVNGDAVDFYTYKEVEIQAIRRNANTVYPFSIPKYGYALCVSIEDAKNMIDQRIERGY